MRAYLNARDADRRHHAVLDEDYWACAGVIELEAVCFRGAHTPVGEWDPQGANNCPKCTRRLAAMAVRA